MRNATWLGILSSIAISACGAASGGCASRGTAAPELGASLEGLDWLVGDWRSESAGGPVYERWSRSGPERLENETYRLCSGTRIVDERSAITLAGGAARLVSGALSWSLVESDGRRCVFAADAHRERIELGHTELGHIELGHTELGHTELGGTELGHIELERTDASHLRVVLQFGDTRSEQSFVRLDPTTQRIEDLAPPPLGRFVGAVTCAGERLETSVWLREEEGHLVASTSTPSSLQWNVPCVEVCWDAPWLTLRVADGERVLSLPLRHDGSRLVGRVDEGELTLEIELALTTEVDTPASGVRIEPATVSRDGWRAAANVFTSVQPATARRAAVVLLPGTGQRRKEEHNGWALRLAERGVVVVAFDKRNVTEFPELELRERPTDIGRVDDLVADALAAIELLRARADVDPARVGVFGFSQGAVLAPLIAARDPRLAFVVAVSGNATTDAEFIVEQALGRLTRAGYDERVRQRARELWQRLFAFTDELTGADALQTDLDAAHAAGWGRIALPRYVPNADERRHSMTWNSWKLDPAAAWRASSCPALVVLGSRDERIPVARSVEILTPLFASSGGARTVRVFAEADHQLRVVPPGAAFRWPRFADGYVELVTDWIAAR
ncbi:MAG: alpha/beta fold hydrolase [Planctomycetes bacterium]|nr:alpha/beta fold hydrolase [Planctomycetota bacterium]